MFWELVRCTSPDPRDGHGGVDRAPSTVWELSIDSNRYYSRPSIPPSTPSRRRASARRRVDGMGLSRSIQHRLHLQGVRSTCCLCLDVRRSTRSGSRRPRAWGVFDTSLRAPELVRRACEERRVVPESRTRPGARAHDVLVERARAEGPVVTAASPTHAVRRARDAAKGRGEPAPRSRDDQMRRLDEGARFTSTYSASTVRTRPLDGGGAQCLVGRTRWLVARHRWL